MPSHGQHSFLRFTLNSSIKQRLLLQVSMPSHGQHSFLLYPFKTLYFMRKTDPLFAGNSQNILKKAFFWGFTRMFTVCSYLSILPTFLLPLSTHFDYTIITTKKICTHAENNSQKPPPQNHHFQFPSGALISIECQLYCRRILFHFPEGNQ